jgi:hypothetical protein
VKIMKSRFVLIVLVATGIGYAIGQIRFAPDNELYAQTVDRPKIVFDDSKTITSYANFCRVTGTPEDVFIDYGINSELSGIPSQPLTINHRIIINFYTAKRMLQALESTVQRHEETFGKIETDVQKRAKSGVDIQTVPTRKS